MVGFSGKERMIGEAASVQVSVASPSFFDFSSTENYLWHFMITIHNANLISLT